VIVDRNGSEVFTRYFDSEKISIIDTRGESINIPVLLATGARHGMRASLATYIQEYVQMTGATVALTHIDNNPDFYRLKAACPELKVVSVQNGARDDTMFDTLAKHSANGMKFHADEVLCFGKFVGQRYADLIETKVEPVGSFMNNLVARSRPNPSSRQLLFLSQYRPPHPDWPDPVMPVGERVIPLAEFYSPERRLLPQLASFCKEHNIELAICGSSLDEHQQEKSFFAAMLGDLPWRFFPRSRLSSSYERVDAANWVVFIDSTLGYEALGRGAKAAAISIRGTVTKTRDRGYGFHSPYPDDGPFWTNVADEAKIERVLQFITTVDDATWAAARDCYVLDVIAFDPDNSHFVSLMKRYNAPLTPPYRT
jgi:surface carbohydrate biosynthesis protein